MSLFVYKRLNSTITLVSQLIELVRPLVGKREFDEINDLLVECTIKINEDMENLEYDQGLNRKECILLERVNELSQIEKSKFQEKLLTSRKECEDLKEKVARLREDQRVCEELKVDIKRLREDQRVCEELKAEIKRLREEQRVCEELKAEIKMLREEQRVCEELKAEIKRLREDQRVCGELQSKIERLREDHRVSDERAKRVDERSAKIHKEQSEVIDKKNKIISDLNYKLGKLKNQLLDSDQTIRTYQEKLKCVDKEVYDIKRELLDLKGQKLAAGQIIEEVRLKQSKADSTVEELKRQLLESSEMVQKSRKELLASQMDKMKCEKTITNIRREQAKVEQTIQELKRQNLEALAVIVELKRQVLYVEEDSRYEKSMDEIRHKLLEADQTVEELTRKKLEVFQTLEELRRQKLEADDVVEASKKKWESLMPRIMMEEGIKNISKTRARNLGNVANTNDKLDSTVELADVNSLDFKGENLVRGEGSMQGIKDTDVEVIVDSSPGCRNLSPKSSCSQQGGASDDNAESPRQDGAQRGSHPPQVHVNAKSSCSNDENAESSRQNRVLSGSDFPQMESTGTNEAKHNKEIRGSNTPQVHVNAESSCSQQRGANDENAESSRQDCALSGSDSPQMESAGTSQGKNNKEIRGSDVIEIYDSDDETINDAMTRKRSAREDDTFSNFRQKKKPLLKLTPEREKSRRNDLPRSQNLGFAQATLQSTSNAVWNNDGFSSESSTDSDDESTSSDCINNLIASLQTQKTRKA